MLPNGKSGQSTLRPKFGHCGLSRSLPKVAIRTIITEITLHTGGVASSILAVPAIFSDTWLDRWAHHSAPGFLGVARLVRYSPHAFGFGTGTGRTFADLNSITFSSARAACRSPSSLSATPSMRRFCKRTMSMSRHTT